MRDARAAVGRLRHALELFRRLFPHSLLVISSSLLPASLTLLCPVTAAERPSAASPSSAPGESSGTELNNQGVTIAKAGNFEDGVALVRRAVVLAPADSQIHKNLSGMLTDWAVRLQEQGQPQRAEDLLKEALEHDADNGHALLLLGNAAYLRKDGLEASIAYWKRAFALLPSSQRQAVSDRIAQAERDRAVERAFASRETPHFVIRFEGEQFGEAAEALGVLLEQQYARLEHSLGSGPSRVNVLLYTRGSFERVAGRRDWALGLYDGRIRLRVEELHADLIADVIAHELTHAWLFEGFGPRLPTWIHEGLAQYQEPDQQLNGHQQALMNGIESRSSWVPLRWIDRRFEQPSNMEDLERAYLEARWGIASLVRKHGMERFRKFLEQLSAGKPIDRAFDEVFAPSRWARFDQGSLE